MEPVYVIMLGALLIGILGRVLPRKLTDRKKIKAAQKESKELQEKWKKLLKEGGAKKEELSEIQMQMLKKQNEAMMGNMKISFLMIPVFLVLLYFLRTWFENVPIQSPIPVIQFVNWVPTGLTTTPGYFEAYFAFSIIFSLMLVIAERTYDSIRHPEEKEIKEKKKESTPETKHEIENKN